jgi:hypothetical protein
VLILVAWEALAVVRAGLDSVVDKNLALAEKRTPAFHPVSFSAEQSLLSLWNVIFQVTGCTFWSLLWIYSVSSRLRKLRGGVVGIVTPIRWVPGALPRGKSGRGVQLTSHLQLVRRSRKRRSLHPFPHTLHRHINVEALQLLNNDGLVRRLHRRKPFELV